MNKYSQKYHITNDSMDINYRLKPISVVMYFQDCVARYMTLKNLAAFDIIDKNLYWIVSEFNIEFIGELPFWSEEIEVITWVSEITKLKIYIDFELKHNNKIFAKGNSCWFILNTITKKPSTTEIISERFEICNEFALGEHKKFHLAEQQDKIATITHTTNLSDIDFNNHVNNKSYLILAETTGTEEFKNSHSLKSLSVKFCKETFLGDVLICSTYKTDTNNLYVHKIEKDGTAVCDITTYWVDKIKETPITECNLKVREVL